MATSGIWKKCFEAGMDDLQKPLAVGVAVTKRPDCSE
jgi:hypothetical protein